MYRDCPHLSLFLFIATYNIRPWSGSVFKRYKTLCIMIDRTSYIVGNCLTARVRSPVCEIVDPSGEKAIHGAASNGSERS